MYTPRGSPCSPSVTNKSKNALNKVLIESLSCTREQISSRTHIKDILAARKLINKLLKKIDKAFRDNPEEEQAIANIGKLTQLLIKLIEIEREINTAEKQSLPTHSDAPGNEEITYEEEKIIKNYAARKYRSRKNKNTKNKNFKQKTDSK